MLEPRPNVRACISVLAGVCLGLLSACAVGANVTAPTVNSSSKSTNFTQLSAARVGRGTLPAVACTNLGTPGTWQDITPPIYGNNTTYNPSDFVVDENTGLVYVGTDSFDDGNSKGVQRSADCGDTWVQVSTGSGSDAINGGRQWTFAINNLDGRIMYTNSGYYKLGLWKSYDGGVDWKDVTPKVDGAHGFIGYLQMDPENPDHLLVSWHEPCYGINNQFTYKDQVGCFHESTDGGRTWKGHYSTGTPWPAQVRALLLHGSTWIVLANNTLLTTDNGQTYTVVNDSSLGGHSSGTLSRANNGDFYIGTQFGAYRSAAASGGQSWTAVGGQWVGEIADTGSLLYETQQGATTLLQSSASADGVNWQAVTGGPTSCEFAHYDVLHKVLYVSCLGNGFWRLVIE